LYAGIVVLRLATLETIEEVSAVGETQFPYVPGLLSFREAPALLEAWAKLQTEPDAVMFDGQGLAHPRRLGIACHAGLLLNRPTIGCAKSVLVGKFDDPDAQRGSWTPIMDKGETVGAALRTKNKVQPVYISPGHLIDLNGAIDLTLRCDGGYRVPEPTRRAHLLVNAARETATKE
jgi:deoxyribonuclease V